MEIKMKQAYLEELITFFTFSLDLFVVENETEITDLAMIAELFPFLVNAY